MDTKIYQPINCDFYDILEASATLKKHSVIEFYNTENQVQRVVSQIIDLFIIEKQEFMKLANGTVIRLDQLVAVDGNILPNAC